MVDKFLALALSSHIVDLNALTAACRDFSTNETDENAVSDLCRHLIDKHVLTEWQCEKLCEGKWKGFWLDKYLLLAQLDQTATTTKYLAQEWQSGRHVAIVVGPPKLRPDGQINFRVEEITNQTSSGDV